MFFCFGGSYQILAILSNRTLLPADYRKTAHNGILSRIFLVNSLKVFITLPWPVKI